MRLLPSWRWNSGWFVFDMARLCDGWSALLRFPCIIFYSKSQNAFDSDCDDNLHKLHTYNIVRVGWLWFWSPCCRHFSLPVRSLSLAISPACFSCKHAIFIRIKCECHKWTDSLAASFLLPFQLFGWSRPCRQCWSFSIKEEPARCLVSTVVICSWIPACIFLPPPQ